MRRKKSQTVVKDTKPKDKAKSTQRVAEKNFLDHIYDIFIPH